MLLISFKKKINKLSIFIEKHEGKFSVIFFLLGFLIDNLTLGRIDSLTNNMILLLWLFVAIFGIFIHNYGDYKEIRNSFIFKIYTFSPYIIQLAFGALFSGFVVYYTRSSTFFDSWPFFVFIYFILIANEKIRNQYEKFYFQIGILYFSILAFLIFYLPVIFHKANFIIFVLSIFISISIIFILWFIFVKFFGPIKKYNKKVFLSIIVVTLIFNIFYFTKKLPPVPLSAKNIDVYHYVQKLAPGKYVAQDENEEWYSFLDFSNKTIHRLKDEPVYVYSSVFAPTDFKTKIKYLWYWFNEKKGKWELKSTYNQKLLGGRDNGFRSWSLIGPSKIKNGKWRVYLETNDDRVIDRINFDIETVDKVQKLREVNLK